MRVSTLARGALIVAAAALAATAGTAAEWKPDKPVRIIVPWSAGGSTDSLMRVISGEIEKALGTQVVVVNQTGASGSVGTKGALDAPKDGLTWTSGAVQDLGTYGVLGLIDTRIEDWNLYLVVRNAPLVSVNVDTPYQTMKQLLDGMRENPGKITVGTSGIPSAAHTAMEAIRQYADIDFRHVTYDGDAPTMVALVSGEIQATAQPAPGQSEMVRGHRVRPLAVVSDIPLSMEGVGEIPPITEAIPAFNKPSVVLLVGIFVPPGAPDEVVQTLNKVWEEKISSSEVLKSYAARNGAIFAPAWGEKAQKLARAAVAEVAWLMFDAGRAKVSPDTLGIPRP